MRSSPVTVLAVVFSLDVSMPPVFTTIVRPAYSQVPAVNNSNRQPSNSYNRPYSRSNCFLFLMRHYTFMSTACPHPSPPALSHPDHSRPHISPSPQSSLRQISPSAAPHLVTLLLRIYEHLPLSHRRLAHLPTFCPPPYPHASLSYINPSRSLQALGPSISITGHYPRVPRLRFSFYPDRLIAETSFSFSADICSISAADPF